MDFRSGKVYEDLALKVKHRFVIRHLVEWIVWPALFLVEETCTRARSLRIEKLRKDLEDKLRYERERKEFEENKEKVQN